IFWDPCLAANLQQECNISYASTPIMGKRKKIKWKDTGDSNFCVIGAVYSDASSRISHGTLLRSNAAGFIGNKIITKSYRGRHVRSI
ncbi:MAG: hypothetical protein VX007_10930, partial [Pseudomonadota bacterium]|nr:hypothetical protein [Pseudomonadota bacterium]